MAEQIKKQHVPRQTHISLQNPRKQEQSNCSEAVNEVYFTGKYPSSQNLERTLALLIKDEKHSQIRED